MAKNNTRVQKRTRTANAVRSENYLNSYYQYSSEAYEIAPAPEEYEQEQAHQRKKRPKKMTRKQRSKMIRKRNAPKYVYEKQQERKISMTSIITVSLIFSGILLYLTTFSMAAVEQHNIQVMNDQLLDIKDANSSLKSSIYDNVDLDKIKDIAMAKLGMVVPEEHKKVYIDDIKQSYFVQNNAEDTENEPTVSLSNFFNLFAGNN